MAVTITAAELLIQLGIRDSTAGNAHATRLLASCTARVERYAPGAPESVQNESVVRFAGWLSNKVPGVMGEELGPRKVEYEAVGAGAFRRSGAMSLLSSWKVRTAGVI